MSNHEPTAKPARRRQRGIFERPAGSRIWWIRYHDEHGREHREKIGPKGLALQVYRKRKTEIAERRFFPERLRRRDVLVADMIDDYLGRAAGRLRCYREYERYGRIWKAALPGRTLRQVLPGYIERYVSQRVRDVAPATVNRELQFLSLILLALAALLTAGAAWRAAWAERPRGSATDTIRAGSVETGELVLRDRDGSVRGRLQIAGPWEGVGGPRLTLYDPHEDPAANQARLELTPSYSTSTTPSDRTRRLAISHRRS
jgi:hypothetical protein